MLTSHAALDALHELITAVEATTAASHDMENEGWNARLTEALEREQAARTVLVQYIREAEKLRKVDAATVVPDDEPYWS